jgi:hypothetical protein
MYGTDDRHALVGETKNDSMTNGTVEKRTNGLP